MKYYITFLFSLLLSLSLYGQDVTSLGWRYEGSVYLGEDYFCAIRERGSDVLVIGSKYGKFMYGEDGYVSGVFIGFYDRHGMLLERILVMSECSKFRLYVGDDGIRRGGSMECGDSYIVGRVVNFLNGVSNGMVGNYVRIKVRDMIGIMKFDICIPCKVR